MKVPKRFSGLKLKGCDLEELRRIKAGGKLSARVWRRILTLEHLHAGLGVNATAKAVGGYHREVSRVGKRYLADGLPAIDGEFVERMEDVLRVYARPLDPTAPVVCLDERPVVLRDAAREGVAMAPGRPARADYEYVRKGTANFSASSSRRRVVG